MDAGADLAVGSYAPVGLTARSGFSGTLADAAKGPLLACNPAFDMIFVSAAPWAITTTVTRKADVTTPACGTTCNSLKTGPGDTGVFTLSTTGWTTPATTDSIPVPWNLEYSF